MSGVSFEVLAIDRASHLRAGLLHTPHGSVPTPTFMPVGTLGSVKALSPADVRESGAGIVLSNSYHLSLRPGVSTVERLGGLHAFMRWNGPLLTDSGGFQVFSLDRLRQVSDAGVTFASHVDGRPMFLRPESVVEVQERLGADLIMPLDECLPADATRAEAEVALERTQAWWHRSLDARHDTDQAMFALIQGGLFEDLRRDAARAAAGEPAPGFAIGGLSVGEPKDLTAAMLRTTIAELPVDRPRYLMGVGHPRDVVEYARLGVDLFDCVLPTRLGRNGSVWCDSDGARLDLSRRAALCQLGPVMRDCKCVVCQRWSAGQLAALYQNGEPLACRLASLHNLSVLSKTLRDLRATVLYTPGTACMAGKASL